MTYNKTMRQIYHVSYTIMQMMDNDWVQHLPRSEMLACSLLVKAENEGELLTVSQVAQHLKISNPAISRTIKNLDAKNFIQRTPDPADRRTTYISLTSKGKQQFQEAAKQVEQVFHEAFNKLDEQEVEDFIQTGNKIVKTFSETLETLRAQA